MYVAFGIFYFCNSFTLRLFAASSVVRHQYCYWLSQRHYIIKTYTSSCKKTKTIWWNVDILACDLKVTRAHRGLNFSVSNHVAIQTSSLFLYLEFFKWFKTVLWSTSSSLPMSWLLMYRSCSIFFPWFNRFFQWLVDQSEAHFWHENFRHCIM